MNRAKVLFSLALVGLLAGGLAFRLPRLDKRPMHCDEANQARCAATLLETGDYRYKPEDHHGPSLYYLTLPSLWLAGVTDFADTTEAMYRVVPVVFGAGLILLLCLVADGLGRGPALAAGSLVAISPAMVYYSRYYVQEMLLVFFTAGAIACGWRYWQRRSIGWAVAAGTCVGLMHATKETWVLAAAAAAGAIVATAVWSRRDHGGARRPTLRVGARRPILQPLPQAGDDHASHGARPLLRPAPIIAAASAAILVAVAFYSSFGSHWKGLRDSLAAYEGYVQRGAGGGMHDNPPSFYLERLCAFRPAKGFFWSEGLIVGLAAVGCVAALRRCGLPETSRPLGRFLAFYTVALTILYSAIPYKTPWCMISFLYGMILLAGVGACVLVRWMPGRVLRLVVVGMLVGGAIQLGRQSYLLNYRFDADPRNPYVYAHASPDVVNLGRQMERLAAAWPAGHDMLIHVVTPENYWPLPWYLRRFNPERIGCWQDPQEWLEDLPRQPPPEIIILTPDVQELVDAHLPAAYNLQMTYGLQPGLLLLVYAREDVWNAFVAAQSK